MCQIWFKKFLCGNFSLKDDVLCDQPKLMMIFRIYKMCFSVISASVMKSEFWPYKLFKYKLQGTKATPLLFYYMGNYMPHTSKRVRLITTLAEKVRAELISNRSDTFNLNWLSCLSHGQLYVVWSKVRKPLVIFVFSPERTLNNFIIQFFFILNWKILDRHLVLPRRDHLP